MEEDAIKVQIQDWLSRNTARVGVREVLNLPIAIGSDIGNVREENQDKAVVLRAQVTASKFFLVGVLCDGMGGMSEGADCASLAVSSFISSCIRNRKLPIKRRLLEGVDIANKDVYEKYNGKGGATLSAFILDSDENFEAINVGDSRVYIGRKGSLEQVSVDDTIAGQLNHQSPPSELSNKLLQFIGIGKDIEPHLLDMPLLNEAEKVMLTSDGVHYLDESTLRLLVTQNVTSIELAKRLIYTAKWCGGHDNSTTIVLSELASIHTPSHVRTGTVQLWDSFGDVQFIGIEKSQPSEPREVALDPALEKDELINSEEKSGDDENKTTQRRSRVKKTKKEKPQLRIDFDK